MKIDGKQYRNAVPNSADNASFRDDEIQATLDAVLASPAAKFVNAFFDMAEDISRWRRAR